MNKELQEVLKTKLLKVCKNDVLSSIVNYYVCREERVNKLSRYLYLISTDLSKENISLNDYTPRNYKDCPTNIQIDIGEEVLKFSIDEVFETLENTLYDKDADSYQDIIEIDYYDEVKSIFHNLEQRMATLNQSEYKDVKNGLVGIYDNYGQLVSCIDLLSYKEYFFITCNIKDGVDIINNERELYL